MQGNYVKVSQVAWEDDYYDVDAVFFFQLVSVCVTETFLFLLLGGFLLLFLFLLFLLLFLLVLSF